MYESDQATQQKLTEIFPELAGKMDQCFCFGTYYPTMEFFRGAINYAVTNQKKIVFRLSECTVIEEIKNICCLVDDVLTESSTKLPDHTVLFFVASLNAETRNYFDSWSKTLNLSFVPSVIYGFQGDEVYPDDYPINIPTEKRKKHYLCLNRMPRLHRAWLISELFRHDIVQHGMVSFGGLQEHLEMVNSPDNNLPFSVDPADFASWHSLKLDIQDLFNINPFGITGHDFERMYLDTYFSVVTETYFFNAQHQDPASGWEPYPVIWPKTLKGDIFFSEKIYRPMYYKQPFILFAVPHSLRVLKSVGYRTFDKWIDETYDHIEDPHARFKHLVDEVRRLTALTHDQWIDMIQEMTPILEHNHHHFVNKPYDRRITLDAIEYFK
jgi:hypothetical protein